MNFLVGKFAANAPSDLLSHYLTMCSNVAKLRLFLGDVLGRSE